MVEVGIVCPSGIGCVGVPPRTEIDGLLSNPTVKVKIPTFETIVITEEPAPQLYEFFAILNIPTSFTPL